MARGKKPTPDAEYRAEYFYDSVGRRRKLSAGAILRIQQEFADGMSTSQIAQEFGVSRSLVLICCYNTPRKSDLEKLAEAKDDVPIS
jgi:AraC-like DNA-binding protein